MDTDTQQYVARVTDSLVRAPGLQLANWPLFTPCDRRRGKAVRLSLNERRELAAIAAQLRAEGPATGRTPHQSPRSAARLAALAAMVALVRG